VLIALEIAAAVATVVLAILWISDPGGNYEPWTVICGLVATVTELCRRLGTRSEEGTNPRPRSQLDELIRWILEHGIERPLSQVLPRALQLAQLAGDRDLEHWVRMEMYGYTPDGGMTEQDTVPEYREITGRYLDQYGRMLSIDDARLAFVNTYRFRHGVRQLEELANRAEMQNLRDEQFIGLIRETLHVDVHRFSFSPVEVTGVLDRVRNLLLEKVNSTAVQLGESTAPDGAME
jgi:hypothetical protein